MDADGSSEGYEEFNEFEELPEYYNNQRW